MTPISPGLMDSLTLQRDAIPALAAIRPHERAPACDSAELDDVEAVDRFKALEKIARDTALRSSSFNCPPRPLLPGACDAKLRRQFSNRFISEPLDAPAARALISAALDILPQGASLQDTTRHPKPELARVLLERRTNAFREGFASLLALSQAEATLRGVQLPAGGQGIPRAPFERGELLPILSEIIVGDAFGLPRFLSWMLLAEMKFAAAPEAARTALRDALARAEYPAEAPDSGWQVASHEALRYFKALAAAPSAAERLFCALRAGQNEFLTRTDLRCAVWSLLHTHPGLAFLRPTPEFQQHYATTVVERMFLHCDQPGLGVITRAAFLRSDLAAAFFEADWESDINRVLRYFSYEHFYVLYCKFWELDAGQKQHLTPTDLAQYDNFALSQACVQRVFAAAPPSSAAPAGAMGFPEFLRFMLCEVDKDSEAALRYWFRVADVDGDGLLGADDVGAFVDAQLSRAALMGGAPPQRQDVITQLFDMVKAARAPGAVSQAELRASRQQANFFNALFSLTRFLRFEEKDPNLLHHPLLMLERRTWDRYARVNYDILAADELGQFPDSAGYTGVVPDSPGAFDGL